MPRQDSICRAHAVLSGHCNRYLLDIPRQPTCMKLGTRELYQPIQSNKSVAVPRQDSMSPALGISNKSVAVPRQDSIRPCRAHAVLSGHCNRYIHACTCICSKTEAYKEDGVQSTNPKAAHFYATCTVGGAGTHNAWC